MIGEIIKVLKTKKSSNPNDCYIRVEFKMEKTGSFAKTDLVPTYRNFARWHRIIKVGNLIGNLWMKDDKTIDADSRPIKMSRAEQTKELTVEELSRLGVFG